MRNTGIVRNVDDLGRIVLPMELRRSLGIKVKDPISVHIDGDKIILTKPQDSCAICGTLDRVMTEFKGRLICEGCIEGLRKG